MNAPIALMPGDGFDTHPGGGGDILASDRIHRFCGFHSGVFSLCFQAFSSLFNHGWAQIFTNYFGMILKNPDLVIISISRAMAS